MSKKQLKEKLEVIKEQVEEVVEKMETDVDQEFLGDMKQTQAVIENKLEQIS